MYSEIALKPSLDVRTVRRVLQERYGLVGELSELPGERDQNLLLVTNTGARYVIKIANPMENPALLEAQNQVLAHLADHNLPCPQVVPSRSGRAIEEVTDARGQALRIRVLTYLPGVPMARVRRHSPALLRRIGELMGRLDAALLDIDPPAFHRDFAWDVKRGVRTVRENAALIRDEALRSLVLSLTERFEKCVQPNLTELPHSLIHNDANDFNLLLGGDGDLFERHQRVTGLLDFGDMVHSITAADLAVALAYALLHQREPLTAAAEMVRGYHAFRPLAENELAALWGMLCLRLCVSVAMAARQQRENPDNTYLSVSQQAIREKLPVLAGIPWRLAEAVFRDACGLEAVLHRLEVMDWIERQPVVSVLPPEVMTRKPLVLDLSVAGDLVHGDPIKSQHPHITERIREAMERAGAILAIGRYDEPRLWYTAPMFSDGDPFSRFHRTIHLGIDFFCRPGVPVRAPLPGTVHRVKDRSKEQDYGPMVILRHETDQGRAFFTLYGHLSRRSIEMLRSGQKIEAGEPFAEVGEPQENGGWPPHLHFQCILDLLDLDDHFPGVVSAPLRHVWRQISPNPAHLSGLTGGDTAFVPGDAAASLQKRRRYIGPSLRLSYREPVRVVRGWMQYLYDDTGRRFLDAYNNVPHVGHAHPRVVEAACRQMAILNTNTRYLHDLLARYAERLCNTLPEPLRVCYFVNSGTEANELAVRLARTYTGAREMIVLEGGYHGHSTTMIDLSPYKHAGPGGQGPPDWVHVAPLPDPYRGRFRGHGVDIGKRYAEEVRRCIEGIHQRGGRLAGFLAESFPSVAGQIVFPEGFLAEAYRHVRKAGGVCIADEIQTAFGRLGTHFYGFQVHGVVPDIVALGKPIGNGHPIGAVITTPEIAAAFDNGMEFFSTFGGNTVSCAVGLAVLDVLQEDGLMERAQRIGHELLRGLQQLGERYAVIGDVRGSGFFLGVELVRDRESREPAGDVADYIVNRLREEGILIGTEGPAHNVLKIRPPMSFSESDARFLLDRLERLLAEVNDLDWRDE